MNSLKITDIKLVLEQNFQNYLTLRRSKRKISCRSKKKWEKFLNLKCKNQLEHGPKVLLSKTNRDIKLHKASDDLCGVSDCSTESITENLIKTDQILKNFDKNDIPQKNNDLVKVIVKNLENGSSYESTISQFISNDSEKKNKSPGANEPVLEVQKEIINNLQNGLENSDQTVSSPKDIKENNDQSLDDFVLTYTEVQNEFKKTDNSSKNNDIKMEDNLKRSSRNRTPAIYDENLIYSAFEPSPKKVTRRVNTSSTRKRRMNSSPGPHIEEVKTENTDRSTVTNFGKYLQIKKLHKNASSSVQLILPQSIMNTLKIQPVLIKIDLKHLDLNQFHLDQNRQDQELANIQETARATDFLTGDYIPPKPKPHRSQPKCKEKPKQKQKTPIADFFAKFSGKEDIATQSGPMLGNQNTESADDLSISQILVTRTSSGWVMTDVESNCVLTDENVVHIDNVTEQNEISILENSIIQTIPILDLTSNNLFPINALPNSQNSEVLHNLKIQVPVQNQYESPNSFVFENDTQNLQPSQLNENEPPNININEQDTLNLSTKKLKRKIDHKVDYYIKLGNPLAKSNWEAVQNTRNNQAIVTEDGLLEIANKLGSLEEPTMSNQRGLDMPRLDLETDNLMNCILSNTLNNSETSANKIQPKSTTNGFVEIAVETNKNTTEENKIQNNATENNDAINYLNDVSIVGDNIIISNNSHRDECLEVSAANNKEINNKQEAFHQNSNSDQLCYPHNLLQENNNNTNDSSKFIEVGIQEMGNKESTKSLFVLDCSEGKTSLDVPSTSDKVIETGKQGDFNDASNNFIDLRNDEMDFEDDIISILGDYDNMLGDELDSPPTTPNLNNSNNILQNNNQQKVTSTSIEESSSIFEEDYIDTDIFGLPRPRQEPKFKIPKKNNGEPLSKSSTSLLSGYDHQSILNRDGSKNPASRTINRCLSVDQPRALMSWPNNPTNIIKHPDQLRVLESSTNPRFPAADQRIYHSNISATKLFGSPCFRFLDFGYCQDITCRFPHFLVDPEILKYQLKQQPTNVLDLAYHFLKEKPMLFKKYAQIFIEIFAERNDRSSLLSMISDCKNYDFRYGWWKSIWMALHQMNVPKSAALELFLQKIPTDNSSNIDFGIDLIIETNVLQFLQYIQKFNDIPNYIFKIEFINRMASIYFETKSLELQNILMSIILKLAAVPELQSQLKHPTVLDFLKTSSFPTNSVGQTSNTNLETNKFTNTIPEH